MDEKEIALIMQKEKEKLLVEINENIKKKKAYMKTNEPETGFQNFKGA